MNEQQSNLLWLQISGRRSIIKPRPAEFSAAVPIELFFEVRATSTTQEFINTFQRIIYPTDH